MRARGGSSGSLRQDSLGCCTHRPFEGPVRSLQMVTRATAQLLSNMAIGALWSCRAPQGSGSTHVRQHPRQDGGGGEPGTLRIEQ